MSTFVPYQHSPLLSPHHIRLLELSSCSNRDDPLVGTMRTVNIVDDDDLEEEDSLPYVALSYRWSEDAGEELLLDGRGTLRISQDLDAALRRFRYASALRWIWIDAICINQQDDEEKSIQIPLMLHIYRGASRVIVWLGNRAEDAELLRRIKSLLRDAKARPEIFGPDSPTPPDVARSLIASLSLNLSKLGQLEWFTRRWILQELALNANAVLCCGQTELPWPQLAGVLGCSKGHYGFQGRQGSLLRPKQENAGLRNIQLLWDLWWNTVISPRPDSSEYHLELEDRGIAALMDTYSNFECSDGRDQIAALIGLSRDARGPTAFRVDYADSVEQTYVKFAETLARTGHLAWLLYQRFQREKGRASRGTILPSWVPDWRLPMVAPPLHARFKYTKSFFCGLQASNNTPNVHLLTTELQREQIIIERYEFRVFQKAPIPKDISAVVSPPFLEISWKSSLFPKGTSLEERVALVLVDLWPHIVARLSEDVKNAEDAKICWRRMWYGLLLQVVHTLCGGSGGTLGNARVVDNYPKFGEEDVNDLEALRHYIRHWRSAQSNPPTFDADRHPEELAEFLVSCQQASDSLGPGSICGMGCVPASFYSQVEVGDKVLLSYLGRFGDINMPWSRYIVREQQLEAHEGFVDSAADGLESTEQSSSHGTNSCYNPDSNSKLVSPLVYEFIAPCKAFYSFLWTLRPSSPVGRDIQERHNSLFCGVDWETALGNRDKVRSIWIR